MTVYQVARLEVEALKEFIDMGNCRPGGLFDSECSPLYWVMNQMMYDKFQGNGWELNLVTGRFEKT